MKKFLFAFVATSVFLLAITNGAIAQTSSKMKDFHPQGNIVKIDKLMSAIDKTASPDDINTKAIKEFKKAYKDASGVKWVKNDCGITAEFASNGIQTVVYYNTKGRWQGSLKNYTEEKFNSKVRGFVKSSYYDYKIKYVQEIETIDTPAPTYLAYIEDDANLKVIRIGPDAMDVYQQFKK